MRDAVIMLITLILKKVNVIKILLMLKEVDFKNRDFVLVYV